MSCSKKVDLSGVFPPITTPFQENEEIAWDKLGENMDKWNNIAFGGYVVHGSNGEYPYLSADEKIEMVRRVKEMAPKGKVIMAGAGCESTRDTIDMCNKMADAGADCVLVITPSYYKGAMTSAALQQHYTKVADASSVPVVLYSVPANTTIDLAPDAIISLSKHPNIIGLKESGGDISKIGNLLHKTQRDEFQILAGSAGFLLPSLMLGAVGGVCALANVLGDQVVQLHALYKEGKMDEALELQRKLIAPNGMVTRGHGVPGLKATLDWYGYYGGPLRSPLQPVSQSAADIIKQSFNASGFNP